MADWDVVGTAPAQIQNPWAVKSVAPAPVITSESKERPGSDTDTQHPLSDAVKFFESSLKNAPGAVHSMISQAGDMVQDPYGTIAQTLLHAVKTAHQALANPGATISSVGSALSNATPEKAGATVGAPIVAGMGVGGVAKGVGALAGAGAEAAAEAASPAGQLGLRSTQGKPLATLAAGSSAGPTLDLQNQTVAKSVLGADAGVPHNVPLDHTALDEAAKAPGSVLDAGAASLPTAPLSPAAQAQITAARGAGRITKGSPIVENYINDAESRLLAPDAQFSGDQIRAERNGMSADANTNMLGDADQRSIGKYQRAVVSALDQHVADTMPANSAISPDMIANARATLAKNYNLRDLIGKGGDIDLQALAADHRENPNKFTGPTRIVAQFAHEHPEVTGSISDAQRIAPPSALHDIASINPIKPVGSSIQALMGWAGRRSLQGRGAQAAAEQTPVTGLGGEFDDRPMNSLASPQGTTGAGPSQRELSLGGEPAPLPPTTPSELASPRPPQTVPPGIQRIQARGAQQPPLGLGEEFPGTPRENNSDLAGVASQGVPEGIVARTPQNPGLKMKVAHDPAFITNNASGESAASQEAINRTGSEAPRFVIDPDGNVTPLKAEGAAVADYKPPKGSIVVQGGGRGSKPTIVDRGGLPQAHANGLMARAFGRGGLGDEF